MKSEITIDDITYKVGDVLEREAHYNCTIVYIGVGGFTCEYLDSQTDIIDNTIIPFTNLKYYKIKKKTRKVVVDYYIAHKGDRYTVKNRLGYEYVRYEYEVEVEE